MASLYALYIESSKSKKEMKLKQNEANDDAEEDNKFAKLMQLTEAVFSNSNSLEGRAPSKSHLQNKDKGKTRDLVSSSNDEMNIDYDYNKNFKLNAVVRPKAKLKSAVVRPKVKLKLAVVRPKVKLKLAVVRPKVKLNYEAIPWLTFEDNIIINQEANQLFNRSKSRPVNALSIIGPTRMGKSFLLNLLAEKTVFQCSSAAAACTSGIDVSPEPLLFSDNFDTFVLDLEGQGDASEEHDVKVPTPALSWLLLSTYVKENVEQYEDLFGHLHIVLRDCPNAEKKCHSIIFDEEETDGLNKLKKNAAIERNSIRESIKSSFHSSKVWTPPKLDISSAMKAPEIQTNCQRKHRKKSNV
eukprot:Awhi_evm1s10461